MEVRRIKLTDYIKTSEDFHMIAAASDVGSSRALLKAATVRRDKIREQVENEPRQDENLKEDVVYKLGMISGLNFILDLPGKANDHIKTLPEGDLT